MIGRKGPVSRPKGWGECPADRRSGAPVVPPSPHAPRARPPVLAAAPTDALISWVEKVGSKSDRVTAGIIGGGGTGKATRPTGGLTLTRQKEPIRGIPPKPSFPGSATSRSADAQESLPARTSWTNTRRSPGLSAALGLSGASHSGALSSSAFPGLCATTLRCGLRPPTKSARRAHYASYRECRPTKRALPLGNRLCHRASAALSNVAYKYRFLPIASLTSQHALRGKYLPQKSASLQPARQKGGDAACPSTKLLVSTRYSQPIVTKRPIG